MRHVLFGFSFTCLAFGSPSAAQEMPEIRSVMEGVYTEAQVEAGTAIYDSICGNCHNAENPLRGQAFLNKWTGRPLYAIWDFVTTRMPYTAPGSLLPEQYAEVLAYILSINGYPSGAEALPSVPFEVANIDFDPPSR